MARERLVPKKTVDSKAGVGEVRWVGMEFLDALEPFTVSTLCFLGFP